MIELRPPSIGERDERVPSDGVKFPNGGSSSCPVNDLLARVFASSVISVNVRYRGRGEAMWDISLSRINTS